jgi:hypothetical protein
MKTVPSTFLVNSMNVLEQKFVEKGIIKDNSKSYKSAYKTFINWAESNNYFLEPIEETEPTVEIDLFKRNAKGVGAKEKVKHTNRKYKDAYTLMALHHPRGKNSGKLVYPNDYINDCLSNDLRLFQAFRKENHACTRGTIIRDMKVIYQILGWLHRYKNVPLEDLRLTSIIQFMELNIKRSRFKTDAGEFNFQAYHSRKAMTRQDAVDLANDNRDLVKEYLKFVGGHSNSQALIIHTCVAIAKFVFREQVGTDDYIDDSDLAIVRRLNQLSDTLNKKAKTEPPTVIHSAKSVPWVEVIDVLQVLRLRADLLTSKNRKPRNKAAVNNDLQAFLSLAFMTLIPTDRSRTYYELEIGRTFVHGLLQDNKLTPVDKLKDKTQAMWYIHLMPDDYKTGRIYKEYWGIMPNVEFEDGKKLYEYIDKWITEGRDCNGNCNHNLFFRQTKTYKVLNAGDWCRRIKTIFESQTGVPVTPKEIRKMYITHLNNSGATNAELKGAAYAQHHSQKMQESVYNSQKILDRIAPVYKLQERLWKESIKPPSKQEN